MRFLLPLLLSLALPVMAAPKYKIQVRNQFGGWQQYQTVHHLPSAARTAQTKSTQSGKQYRIFDDDGRQPTLMEANITPVSNIYSAN